ncbi:epimerase [Bifidobacterium vansinderenii]|uniref:Epimerase n=2 Tax=Bifidobacterium vansinderenii TaxID=1984871 RepID=A0A229VUW0_9BIFI|nr:epimerase [Bifidobacterium vansinderenii]
MLTAACVFAILAGLLHVVIFVLESFRWTEPKTMTTFSIPSLQEAEATKEMAYNQGFYNLFLGAMALVGAGLALCGQQVVGVTLMIAGTASMALAALVLFTGSPDKRGAALKQFAFPAITLLLLLLFAVL